MPARSTAVCAARLWRQVAHPLRHGHSCTPLFPSFASAMFSARRGFAVLAASRPWLAKKRLRGLRKRAGASGVIAEGSNGDARAASSATTVPASAVDVLAPSVALPERPPPRTAKEAAEVANARLEHAIQENARTFMTLHEQQQQAQSSAATNAAPAAAAAVTAAKGTQPRRSKAGGNRLRKARAAVRAKNSTPVAPHAASSDPRVAGASATELTASTAAHTSAQTDPEDEAEAAAIAAAVEKVLNAAAAASGPSSDSASATQAKPASASAPASVPAAGSKKPTGRAVGAASSRGRTTQTRARHEGATDAAEAHGVLASPDAVTRAREAMASGKHKILAAAAAAVVTDVVHARAREGDGVNATAGTATAARPASVTSFAASLRGQEVALASAGAGTTTNTTTTALPAQAHGAAGTKAGKGGRAARKGRRAASAAAPSASTGTSASLMSSGTANTPEASGASSAVLTSSPPATAAGEPSARPRGRKLSDEVAANATATAIVRRLTAFTGLNREQQAKLKRLLLTRQHRLLQRRRRLMRRAQRAAAATARANAALATAAGHGQPGAMEPTPTSLAPACPQASTRAGSTTAAAPKKLNKKKSSHAATARKSVKDTAKSSSGATAPAVVAEVPVAAPHPVATATATMKVPKGRNPLTSPDHRERILHVFERLAEVNLALGEKYKTQSYVAAVERLKKGDTLFQYLPPHLEAVDESTLSLYGDAEQVKAFIEKRALARTCAHVPGIGDKLKRKMVEILQTGGLAELDALEKKPIIQAIKALTQVHGVGPRTAVHLYKDFGITTVEEMKAYVDQQDKKAIAAGTSGSGGKTKKKSKDVFTATEAQRLGLRYHKDILRRIPHSEGRLHEAFLKLRLKKHFGRENYELVVCGSYRRECPDSGDIDVLITTTATNRHAAAPSSSDKAVIPPQEVLSAFIDVLREEKYVEASLAQGPTKFMGMCRLRTAKDSSRRFPARRLDVRFVDADSFAAAILYFTGSKNFNVVMRAEAIKRNFVLNEYGLFRNQSRNTLATNKLHEAISKLSKSQFYGGQPNDILKQQEKRVKEEKAASDASRDDTAEASAAASPKKKLYTKAELQELYALWQYVESLRVPCRTEEDVFNAIGMAYVAPKDRNI